MCHPLMLVFSAVLFFVLTPGIFLSLPAGGTKYTKAAVHAVVFAVVFYLTYKLVLNYLYMNEGFGNLTGTTGTVILPDGSPGNPYPPPVEVFQPDKNMLRACNKAMVKVVNNRQILNDYVKSIQNMATTCSPMANL